MKKLITFFALALCSASAQAEVCKVKIYYDANGNRIQRAIECPSEHPNPNSVSLRSSQKQMNGTGLLTEGGSFQVFPNPAANQINIKIDAALLSQGCGIVMTDLTGKTLRRLQHVVNPVTDIDLHGYADGTYLIIFIIGNERQTVKFVKQTGSNY
jgi:hypothetical protein